jgi:formylglycine-generating enzyme required for sulfatase activity
MLDRPMRRRDLLLLIPLAAPAIACQRAEGREHSASAASARVAGASMAGVRAPRAASACPSEMAEAAGVCVDRYEAHLVLPVPGSGFERHPHFERPPEGKPYEARSEAGVFPQAYISRIEAAAACERAGKRLCTAVEWHRACRGKKNTVYPYGARYETGRCNVGRPHLLSRFFGANPNNWSYEHHFNNPKLDQEPGFLLPAGERENCASDFGTHDMVGNLHEWVSDRVDKTLAQRIPLIPGIRAALGRSTGKGVFLGGFFSTTDEHGRGCDFVTTAHEPAYHDYSTGFRCCRSL